MIATGAKHTCGQLSIKMVYYFTGVIRMYELPLLSPLNHWLLLMIDDNDPDAWVKNALNAGVEIEDVTIVDRQREFENENRLPRKEIAHLYKVDPTKMHCIKCGDAKNEESCYPDLRARDGFQSVCIECQFNARNPNFVRRVIADNGDLQCTNCKGVMPYEDFGIDKRTSTGRKSHCRACCAYKQQQYKTRRV